MAGDGGGEKTSYPAVAEKLKGNLGLARKELEERHNQYFDKLNGWCYLNRADLQSVVENVEQRLEEGWFDRWKNGDNSVWVGPMREAGKFENIRWPGRMERFGITPEKVVETLIPVIAERAMNEMEMKKESAIKVIEITPNLEVVRGELVDEMKNKMGTRDQESNEVVDAEVKDITEGETGNCLEKNTAIVQFEGTPIQQVRVKERDTCVLAVMQMLLSHAGFIRNDWKLNLVEAKGKMIGIAEGLGALSRNTAGTLDLYNVPRLVRPTLEETKQMCLNSGLSNNDVDKGLVEVETMTDFAEQASPSRESMNLLKVNDNGLYRQRLILGHVLEEYSKGKNIIFGFTQVDSALENNMNGHQLIINGVAHTERGISFHILDPLGGAYWREADKLARQMSGPIFFAESRIKSGKPVNFSDNELEENKNVDDGRTVRVNGKGIRWG